MLKTVGNTIKQILLKPYISTIVIGGITLLIFVILILAVFLGFLFFPVTIIIYLAYKYTKLNSLILLGYDYFFYKSEKPRKFLWGLMYDLMVSMYPLPQWRTMNYGYAILNEEGRLLNNLDEQQEEERFSLQLYHYVATQFLKLKTLKGQSVVEVGSGRGGGLHYIATALEADTCVGVDYSQNQVDFCNRTYNLGEKLKFLQGDAENLNLNKQFDLVINVESSHCYGDFQKFIRCCTNALKTGGYLVFTDFRGLNEIAGMEKDLVCSGLKLIEKIDITVNVTQALKLDEKRKLQWMQRHCNYCNIQYDLVLRPFFRKFSGVKSSRIFQEFNGRQSLYMAYILQKV